MCEQLEMTSWDGRQHETLGYKIKADKSNTDTP